jgi:hypothetical protein
MGGWWHDEQRRARERRRLIEARVAAGEMRAGNYGKEREYWQAECDRLDKLIRRCGE